MKTPIKCVGWLLPLLLTACFHKTQQAQNQHLAPPIPNVPLPTPPPAPSEIPSREATQPVSQPAPVVTPPSQPEEKPVKHKKRRPTPDLKTDQASNTETPAVGVSAIGQLSPGDSSDTNRQVEISITATENGLRSITRQLNDQEKKTEAQIREFLKQARTALTAGDTDGANTLALKAKVLLNEISQ
jgi:hypothetical protein